MNADEDRNIARMEASQKADEDRNIARMEASQKTYRTMLVLMVMPYCKGRDLDSVSNKVLSDIMNQVKPLLPPDVITGCIMSHFKKDYFWISFEKGMDWKGFFNHITKPDAIDHADLSLSATEFYDKAKWSAMDRLTTTWVDFSYDLENVVLDLGDPFSHDALVDACVGSFNDGLWEEPPFPIKGSLEASTPTMFRVRLEMECPPMFAFYMVSDVCSRSNLKGHVLFERLEENNILDSSFHRKGYKWTVYAAVSSVMMRPYVSTIKAHALGEAMVKVIDDAMHCRGASTESFQTLRVRLVNQLKRAPHRYEDFLRKMCTDVGIHEDTDTTSFESQIPFLRRSLMRFLTFLDSCKSVLVYSSRIASRFKSSRLGLMVTFHEVEDRPQEDQAKFIAKHRSRCYQRIRIMLESLFSMSQKFSFVSMLETAECIGRAMDDYNVMFRQEALPRCEWASIANARTDRVKYVLSPYEDCKVVNLAAPIQERNALACRLLCEKGNSLASMHNAVNKYRMDMNKVGDAVTKLITKATYTDAAFDESAWVLLDSIFKGVHSAHESMEICEHFVQIAWRTNQPDSQLLFKALLPSFARLDEDLHGAQERMFTLDLLPLQNLYPAPDVDPSSYDSDNSQDLSMLRCDEEMSEPPPSPILRTEPRPLPIPVASPMIVEPTQAAEESQTWEPESPKSPMYGGGIADMGAEEPESPQSPVYNVSPPSYRPGNEENADPTREEKAAALSRPVMFASVISNDGSIRSFLDSGGRYYQEEEDSTLPAPRRAGALGDYTTPIPRFSDDEIKEMCDRMEKDPFGCHFMWIEHGQVGMVFELERHEGKKRVWAKLYPVEDLHIKYPTRTGCTRAVVRAKAVPFLDIDFCVDDRKSAFNFEGLDCVIRREVNKYVHLYHTTTKTNRAKNNRIRISAKSFVEIGPNALSEGYIVQLTFDTERMKRQKAPWKMIVSNVSDEARKIYANAAEAIFRMEAKISSLGREEPFWMSQERDPKRRAKCERVMFGKPPDSEFARGESDSQPDPEGGSDSSPDFNPKRKHLSKKKRTSTKVSTQDGAAFDAAAARATLGGKSCRPAPQAGGDGGAHAAPRRSYGSLAPRAALGRFAPK